ncbi:hypothetical protein L6452_09640 [Arctium lappa]|uniref:Uncharacterized protein n=1 Tax=Arctium lappa TaxID=4217 RepID=A0ACB9DKJ4_ARCLA|nr:hypothetical protein L6452_09640 [Arctium lappa]
MSIQSSAEKGEMAFHLSSPSPSAIAGLSERLHMVYAYNSVDLLSHLNRFGHTSVVLLSTNWLIRKQKGRSRKEIELGK